jgi:hypothetical protein
MPDVDLLETARTTVEPASGRPLGEAVRSAQVSGDRLRVEIELGFPVGGYEETLRARSPSDSRRSGGTAASRSR